LNAHGSAVITLTVSDEDLSASTSFTLQVTPVNDPPTVTFSGDAVVDENVPGAAILTLAVVDPDEGDTLSYDLSDGRFEVVSETLRLKANQSLDHEAEPEVPLVLTATDSSGGSDQLSFTVIVRNVNEAPTTIVLDSNSLPETASGAAVGRLSAEDQDAADRHVFDVADDRFEVDGTLLKLKDGVSVRQDDGATIEVEVTATDSGSPPQQRQATLTIQVLANPAPWHNQGNARDASGDGDISPIDALVIINELNRPTIISSTQQLPTARPAESDLPFYDVNEDGFATAIDTLIIINFLNDPEGQAEGEWPAPLLAASVVQTASIRNGNTQAARFESLQPEVLSRSTQSSGTELEVLYHAFAQTAVSESDCELWWDRDQSRSDAGTDEDLLNETLGLFVEELSRAMLNKSHRH
jgi:hypothetical protein